MANFGDVLKDARIAKRYTLREVSNNIGKSIGYLSDIEHNRKRPPELEIVSKIEQFLSISNGSLVNLANKIRKNFNEEWAKTSNLSKKLKADPKLSTILLRAESLTDAKKDEVIKKLEEMEEN